MHRCEPSDLQELLTFAICFRDSRSFRFKLRNEQPRRFEDLLNRIAVLQRFSGAYERSPERIFSGAGDDDSPTNARYPFG